MKTSVSSYSFSQYIREGKLTQLDCVAKAKEMGFDGIEFTDLNGANLEEQKAYAAEIKAEADRVGIEIVSYTIGGCLYKETREEMDAEVARLKGQVEVAAILGAKTMRHDVCYQLTKTGDGRSFDMMLPYIADNARQITEYAQTLGVKTCTENHGYIAQDSDRVERLFNTVHHENYGLLVDMGNFVCADENPQTAVSRVAPYAVHVHVKDMLYRSEPTGDGWGMTRACNYFKGTVVGEGDVPVKKCLQFLKRAGYDGFVSIEFEGAGDCVDGIARGLANLQKMIAQLD
jgi:sugar phosphate isomerase/epimerase